MRVALKCAGNETKLGEFPVGPNMGPVQSGQVDLTPGDKELTVAFINDAYEKDKGDRNLYVKAIRLVPVDDQPDKLPPKEFDQSP